jgi:hypothetical protein
MREDYMIVARQLNPGSSFADESLHDCRVADETILEGLDRAGMKDAQFL